MRIIAASAAIVLSVAAVQAEPMTELSEGGRYQLMDVNERIIRLDTETGGFDVCRMEGEAWSCQVARDNRESLEERVAALTERVGQLEAELAARADGQPRAVSGTGIEASPLPQPAGAPTAERQAEAELTAPAAAPVPVAPLPQATDPQPPHAAAPAPAPEPQSEGDEKGMVARLYDLMPGFSW